MFVFLISLLLVTAGLTATIEEVMDKALRDNPELKALREEKGTFLGLEKSLSAFPNPEIGFESGFLTTDIDGKPRGRGLYLLDLSQEIPLWGVRGKGRELARSMGKSFEWQIEQRKREILGEVYASFYRALFRKEVLRIARENLRVANEVLKFVKTAYELGEVTELELYRAKREKDLALTEVKIAEAELEASLRELSRTVGSEIDNVEGDLSVVREIEDISPDEVPSVIALKKEIESFDRQIELEKALAKPQLSAGFVIEDSDEGYYGLRGALSLGIPIFYRRQGEIIEATSRKKAAGELLKGETFRINQSLESIRVRYETLRETLRSLEDKTIPTAKKELELALRSYRLRSITLLELSDTRRRYYELLTRRAEILRDLHEVYSLYISFGGWKP